MAGTLVGEEVLTLDAVGDVHRVGPRAPGRRALAGHVSGSGDTIPERHEGAGHRRCEGTTLVVWPVDGEPAELPNPMPPTRPIDRLTETQKEHP